MNKLLAFALAVAAPAAAEVFTNQHVDVSLAYDSAAESPLFLRLAAGAISVAPEEAILQVDERAKLFLPEGTPFGDENDPIWILPQTQDPQLLYLGISAEDLPPAIFPTAPEIRLESLDGPGHFFLWQASPTGGLIVRMNSRDGIGPEDTASPIVGSHEHLNWGFTAKGIYKVAFRVAATLAGSETETIGSPQTLTFHVLPLPLTPFVQWQHEIFGPNAPAATSGPGADPDLDSLPNLLEYLYGTNPLDPHSQSVIAASPAGSPASFEFDSAVRATDIRVAVLSTASLAPPNWRETPGAFQTVSTSEGRNRIRFADADPSPNQRFYKLQISLVPR